MPEETIFVGSPLLWVGFTAVVLAMLALDLFVFHRRAHEVTTREALGWSVFWVVLSLVFNGLLWWYTGSSEKALEFLTGYLLEKSLSIDNLFVFLLLFSYFSVPAELEHRVLFWGILGALLMRALFILLGAALLDSFHWFIYVFGAFLLGTGAKLFFSGDVSVEPEKNLVFRFFKRFIPSVPEYREDHFMVKVGGRWFATPLLAVLLVIEASDVVFAVDSIPAIFGVTRDTFIVYSSNVCAILGLRAMYFLLASYLRRFKFLHYGLALVLVFIGVKMLVSPNILYIPVWLSLGVVAGLIGGSILVSVGKTRNQ